MTRPFLHRRGSKRGETLGVAKAFFGPCLAAVTLVGCTIEPTRVDPEAIRERMAKWTLPSEKAAEALLVRVPYTSENASPWWEAFDDPILAWLVKRAQDNAFDVRTAVTRVAEAQARLRAAQADLLPTVNLNASLELEQPDLPSDRINRRSVQSDATVGLGLDWQVDLFDQTKTSIKAAEARAGSAEALVRDLQRVITSEVVANYVQVRSLQARGRLSRDSEIRRTQNVTRAEALLERSYGTSLDVSRSQNQLFQTRADGTTLSSGEVALSNRLAVLTAQPLDNVRSSLVVTAPLAMPPNKAPFPTIAQLLAQRPDLRASEQALVAAALDVDASKAALYPNLNLRADIFSTAIGAGRLLPALNVLSGRILSNLAVPLLNRGRLLAEVDASTARLDGALIAYENAVVNVVSEIDTALNSLKRSRDIHQLRMNAARAAREAAEASRNLFLAGEVDYVSVVVAEQTRSAAEDAALSAERDAVLAYVTYMSAVAPAW